MFQQNLRNTKVNPKIAQTWQNEPQHNSMFKFLFDTDSKETTTMTRNLLVIFKFGKDHKVWLVFTKKPVNAMFYAVKKRVIPRRIDVKAK